MLRKKNNGKNNTALKRICGIVMIGAAVYAFLSYYGLVNVFFSADFNTFQQYFFGRGAFLLPLVLLALGIRLVSVDLLPCLTTGKLCLFFLFVLCFLGTAHNIFVPVNQELYPDQIISGGGLIGGFIVLPLHRLIGLTGTWFLLGLCWLIILYAVIPFKKLWATLFTKHNKPASNTVAPLSKARVFTDQEPSTVNRTSFRKNYERTGSVYKQEEFAAFTDGINNQHSFKRILNFNKKNIYAKKEVKEAIQENPVEIPEWEEERRPVIVRPIINYDAAAKQEKEDQKIQQFQQIKSENIIVHNPYKDYKQPDVEKTVVANIETKAKLHDADVEVSGVTIYDSAEKQYQDNTAVPASSEIVKSADNNAKTTIQESNYKFPSVALLDVPKITDPVSYESDIVNQCSILEQTLADFRVKAKVVAVTRGPSVTRFELEPAPGVKVSSVVNLADDIALKLAASGVRIEAPIPGKAAIGIEVPNIKNDPVYFREVVDNANVHKAESKLCIGLGKDISGNIITADLAKMPHLLVAGSTGSGKSVCINTIIAGLLYKASPSDVKLILVDPKVVELSNYNGIPHLLTPVVTDAKKAASALHWAVAEMERRYQMFADNHVREINSYNQKAEEKMPFIVIIIDELSDLMMVAKVDVEDAILRLAQKARAAGIHLILATQRPSVDVITGIVKANIPSRIAFAVSSQTDSRTILDMGGAEKLLGKGDMLFYPIGYNKPVRVQGAFVSDAELNRIVDFIIKQSIPVNYSDEVTTQALECENKNNSSNENNSNDYYEDELFESAVQLVVDMGQASSSMLQRRFRIGYTRAARLVDMMEELGIVSQSAGSKPREVILSRQEIEERFFKHE